MIVVADTSPIQNLQRIGRLNLLHELYCEIVIPQAVFVELSVPGEVDFINIDWLKVCRATSRQLVDELTGQVDAGEAEAVALASELYADLLLIDEKRGRALAIARGSSITGLAGVLVDAKHGGAIGLREASGG